MSQGPEIAPLLGPLLQQLWNLNVNSGAGCQNLWRTLEELAGASRRWRPLRLLRWRKMQM